VRRPVEQERPNRHSFRLLLITAIGTSIDALAVGVTLAFLNAYILLTEVAIGLATFMMTTVGFMVGRFIGGTFGRIAEALGGLGLILIGAKILIEHTMLS
jgi:manganese efflux pump family protein